MAKSICSGNKSIVWEEVTKFKHIGYTSIHFFKGIIEEIYEPKVSVYMKYIFKDSVSSSRALGIQQRTDVFNYKILWCIK